MIETVHIQLQDAEKMAFFGHSLSNTLYHIPVTILCRGEVGSGKTTFVRGMARGLGIEDPVTSPTFALEQRLRTPQGLPFLHLDLYRLTRNAAREQIRATDDHDGIRCIEWADRAEGMEILGPTISIALTETPKQREAHIQFEDVPLPSAATIDAWQRVVRLPAHIVKHCDAVASLALRLGQILLAGGTIVRLEALHQASKLHDLFRFIDFCDGAGPADTSSAEDRAVWDQWAQHWRSIDPSMKHEEACARFLAQKGFEALGCIVAVHGLTLPEPARTTTEQKLLFYADKRVSGEKVVTLDERFADFRERYNSDKETDHSRRWYQEVMRVERELFPKGNARMQE